MELTQLIGFALAVLVGVSLGLIGSGGSILTVPILVYVMGVSPVLATAYSLFIVGATALVGGVQNALLKKVDFRTVLVFGIPSIAGVYATRSYILPRIPEEIVTLGHFVVTKSIALMVLFAVVMLLASFSMIRPSRQAIEESTQIKFNYPLILIEGILVGILTGLVGAGGGFLIIPALVLLAKMPMKLAVGTSLFIIAAKSLIGFTGDMQHMPNIDYSFMLLFTLFSLIGIVIGIRLSKHISGAKLKTGFGWFVLVMGVYIILKELFLSQS
ncbi:MAG: sulfite exporter TauE/SafE family protein [Flavobacterium sp.]